MANHDWYLGVHVVNAHSAESASVEFVIMSRDAEGDWFNQEGWQVWPFWFQPIEAILPAIPKGWLEHLQAEASKYASGNAAPRQSLAEALGLNKSKPPSAPIVRRI